MPNLDQEFIGEGNNSDIEIAYFFNFLKRKSLLILLFTTIAALVGGIISLRIKPVYEGNFKIYDKTRLDKLIIFRDELINKYELRSKYLVKISDTPEDLISNYIATQEYILKSPNTIKQVFIKYNQTNKKNNNIGNINFNAWSKKLSLKFINKADIISVSFKDKDKELVIETLNNLKLQYEKYLWDKQKIKFSYASEIIKSRYLLEKLDNELKKNEDLLLEQTSISKGDESMPYLKNISKNEYSNSIKYLKAQSREFEEYREILEKLLSNKTQQNNSIAISDIEIVNEIFKQNKSYFILRTTFISFLVISICLLILENLSKTIYDFEILKKLIKSKFLGVFYYADKINSKTFLNEIINKKQLKKSDVVFLLVNSIPNKEKNLSNYLYAIDKNLKQIEISNLESLDEFVKIIIVTSEGVSSYKDIELLNNYIFIFEERIKGWIFIK